MAILLTILLLFFASCNSSPQKKSNIRWGEKSSNVFTDIYRTGHWGVNEDGEGTSGYGSTPEYVKEYLSFLQQFIEDREIKKVVDVGCGDFQISGQIDWDGREYVGIDVVQSVIQQNKKLHGKENIHFLCKDIVTDSLPKGDLLICKDVLQHLTNEDISKFLQSIKGNYHYVLFINDIASADPMNLPNREILRGAYRPIDLQAPPFQLNVEKLLTFSCKEDVKQVVVLCD